MQYQLLGQVPTTLLPGQSVTVAYRITCLQSFPGSTVQTAMLGTGSGVLAVAFGLIAFGWPTQRRRWLHLGLRVLSGGVVILLLAVPAHLFADGNGCFSYENGSTLVATSQCVNGEIVPCQATVDFSYVYNNCPGTPAPAPAVASVTQSSGGGTAASGGVTTQPASIGGGKGCLPPTCPTCPANQPTVSWVDLTQEDYRDSLTDLTTKIVGGTAPIQRNFYENTWNWPNLTEKLTLNPGSNGVASINFRTLHFVAVDATLTTFVVSLSDETIFSSSSGYKYENKDGAWETFDPTGKPLANGYRNLTYTQLQYDTSGNLIAVNDAKGNLLYTVQSSNGLITAITDGAGRTVQYTYSSGELTGVTDPLGQKTSYSYDSSGDLTSKTDVDGNTFTINYSGGAVTSEVDSKGNGWFFQFSYDSAAQQFYSSVKTTNGKVEEKTFALDGTMLTDVLNGVPQRTVVRSGENWTVTEANGATVQQSFDEFNNLTKEVRPEGTTLYTYEPQYNQPTQITYADGTVSNMSYDANGNLLSKTEAAGTAVARTTTYSYDVNNQLTEKVDPRGNKTDYVYDAHGNLVREFDPANPSMQVTYTYDAVGNRLTKTDSLNHTTTYTYDAMNRVVTETNALGQQTINTYAGKLLVQTETGRTANAAGHIQKYVYDQQGRRTQTIRVGNGGQQVIQTTAYDGDSNVVSQANALGQASTTQYDSNDRPIAQTQPFGTIGSTRSTQYDAAGRVTQETDPLGVVTAYTYDQSDRVIAKTEAVSLPQQRTTSSTYDALNRMLTTTYSDGTNSFTTAYAYDALGRRTAVSGQREYAKTTTYDANDNVLTETDALGHTISYQYDAYNRRTQVNNAGQITTFAYDLNGNLISTTDGNGVTRTYTYDALNRQVAQSVPGGSTALQTTTYDAFGQVVQTQDAAGGISTSKYDDFGRVTQTTNAAGLTLTYAYNAADQVTQITWPNQSTQTTVYNAVNAQLVDSVTDRAGNTTSFSYDARFQRIRQTASNGGVTQTVFDPLGRTVQQTDALGHTTLWAYDQFDQMTQMVYPDSTTAVPRVARYQYDAFGKLLAQSGTGQYPVSYQYDAAGNRTALLDGNQSKTQWGYDALNRVTSKTYADSSSYHYSYDPAGNLATRTDALGRTTHYAYNTYNLVTQVQYPTNPAVTFAYDVLGRRTQMTDGTGTTTWTWNAASQNIGASQSAIGQGLTYSYDAENHRTGMAVGSWTTGYTYDAAGRLQTLTDSRVSATTPFSYAYQAQTNWVAGHSNADGSASINQYDVLGRLVQISAATGAGAGLNTYGYTYDAAGQRTQEASTVGTRDFAYDNQRQLTSAYRVDSSGQPLANYNYSFAYDPIGNWQSETANGATTTFTANALNQYTAITNAKLAAPQNPSYDANGNMTSDGQGNTYVYDEENRLIEADTPGTASPSSTSPAKVVSVYDGLSRRVEKRAYDSSGNLLSTTRYLYDGLLPIAEADANNVIQRTYTRGLDLSGTMQGAGGIGGLLALTDGTGSYSYFCDGNGNVVDLTNAYGVNVSHPEYDPFGNVVAQTGTLQQPYQWSSKENDGNGLVYYLYRFYNPSLGRWLNRDPLNEQGTVRSIDERSSQINGTLKMQLMFLRFINKGYIKTDLVSGEPNYDLGADVYDFVANNAIDGIDPVGFKCKKCGIKKAPKYDKTGPIPEGTQFSFDAEFLDDDTHDSFCCHLEQLIKWNKPRPDGDPNSPDYNNGAPHSGFDSGHNQPGEWYQDRARPKNYPRYGDQQPEGQPRDQDPNNVFSPDGSHYHGQDQPGFSRPNPAASGWKWYFRLIVYDRCNGGSSSNPMYTSPTLEVDF